MRDKEYLEFHLARSCAHDALDKLKIRVLRDDDGFMNNLTSVGLHDAKVLFTMFLKEVKQHNSAIEKKHTRISNLHYMNTNWRNSKLFHGLQIPWKRISKIVDENPEEKDWYELYKKL